MNRVGCARSLCCVTLAGCGAGNHGGNCSGGYLLRAGPALAGLTPDHTAVSPANQEQFYATATATVTGTGCAVPALSFRVNADWASSDAVNVTVSSAKDDTNGLATCVGATLTPVTLSATALVDGTPQTATATISCK